MPPTFYSEIVYRKRQAAITKENWRSGTYDFMTKPLILKSCKNLDCNSVFSVKPGDPKIFCSKKCACHINNMGRVHSVVTKMKISKAIALLPKSKRGKHFTKTKVKVVCLACKKSFKLVPYLSRGRKFCSPTCAMRTIGRKTTSAKASKGKNGVRKDIDPTINFYSTWEANMARVFNLVGLKWQFSPKIFDLGKHTYRPDFYLPDFDMFIEIKNFLGPYSLERDTLFRQKFPKIKLDLILKNDYLKIKSNYESLVDNWEY